MIPTSHTGFSGDAGATHPALPAIITAPQMGVRAPERVRLPQRVAAAVTAPILASVLTQDATWRTEAMQLAFAHDATCAATFIGMSARGTLSYRVPAARRSALAYRVSFAPRPDAQTIDDGRWLCECAAGRRGAPCLHVGAAYLLANRRAIVGESITLAYEERLSAAWATPCGGYPAEHLAFYRVACGQGRRWDYLRIGWDTRNGVAVWCDCGGAGPCAHIGAVALRVASDRAYLQRHRDLDVLN